MWVAVFIVYFVRASLYEPEQVHIAWTDEDSSMSVTWASESQSPVSYLEYTPINFHNES